MVSRILQVALLVILLSGISLAYPASVSPNPVIVESDPVLLTIETADTIVYKYGYYSINGAPWVQYTLLPSSDTLENWYLMGP